MKGRILTLEWKDDTDFKQNVIALLHKAVRSKWFQAACIAAFVFLIYFLTGKGSTTFDHFVRLSDAFLHGRLYLVDAPPWLELSRYGDKAFVINPPAPTLFVLPWVAIWGLSTNQAIITMLVGSATVGLFWVAATQLSWSIPFKVAMIVLFAFGTNFWWAAADGAVWMFAHISAVFFLMAALVETTGKNRPWLIGILVGLAGLSRLPTFLAFPFFAYTISSGIGDRRIIIRRLVVFGLSLASMGIIYMLYTYGEYGSFTFGYEKGQFVEGPWYSHGLFDISYIPRHLNAILVNTPVVTDQFPYLQPSYIGLGLFLTTPAFLYVFRARLRERLSLAALITIILISIPIITYAVTGWAQFGYRFSLDLLPFIFILLASGMRYHLSRLIITLIILSCVINLWGTLSFHKFDWSV